MKQRSKLAHARFVLPLLLVVGVVVAFSVRWHARESEHTEMLSNLRSLYDSSVVYYDSQDVHPGQFPESVAPTPPLSALHDGATVDSASWAQPTWQALRFEVPEPHRYAYSYHSEGTRREARFMAVSYRAVRGGFLTSFRAATAEPDYRCPLVEDHFVPSDEMPEGGLRWDDDAMECSWVPDA